MPRLNQIVAVVSGKKSKAQKDITDLHKKSMKAELYEGFVRKYEPAEDESSEGVASEKLPDEKKIVQLKFKDVLEEGRAVWSDFFDVVLTQDVANTKANANVVVGEQVIVSNAPVTSLMFLEKQLGDVKTFIEKLPVLDPSEEWDYDDTSDVEATEPAIKVRTQKVLKPLVKAEATDKHAAQVDVVSVDQIVGNWHTTRFSGALSAKKKNDLLERVVMILEAVKFAREEANSIEVEQKKCGKAIFDFLFEN